jgi:hypothetical protein
MHARVRVFSGLLYYFHDAPCARLNEHRAAVHDGIAIAVRGVVLGRNLIIADAFFRKDRANRDWLTISVRWDAFAHDVLAEARTLVNAKQPGNTAGYAADNTADNSADRSCGRATFSCAAFRAADDTLRARCKRKRRCKRSRTYQNSQSHHFSPRSFLRVASKLPSS